MVRTTKIGLPLLLSLVAGLATLAVNAQQRETPRPPAHGEPHPGPRGYHPVRAPKGWNNRPANFDRGAYQHNFQAARSFHIGVYHRPVGWVPHRWVFGEILPPVYWAAPYILADYWLFSLEVPPPGYEWVRDDTDAILVNIQTGEILQVEYGVFG